MELCKIKFDGNHFLALPYKNISYYYTTKQIIEKNENDLGIEKSKKMFFKNEQAEIIFPSIRKKNLDKFDYTTVKGYLKLLYNMERKEMNNKELYTFLYDNIYLNDNFSNEFDFNNDNDLIRLEILIKMFIENMSNNLKKRKQRFKLKAYNNDWNYFVTFTYDDKKHNENTFVSTLKKKLQNLHTREGWLYMGCFERSKSDRLHFHDLIYIPNNEMKGNIRKELYYDTTSDKQATSYINEDFEQKLGRNDFKPISKYDLMFTNLLDYIIKYIGKEDNKIIYSRGIKNNAFGLVDTEENLICKVSNESSYYVVADEQKIVSLTKDLNYL